MTDHPITPPPELSDEQVGEWLIDDGYPWDPSEQAVITITASRLKNVARQAAQWGADMELEACVKLLELSDDNARDFLYSARRPKPPSLKEQALTALERYMTGKTILTEDSLDTIRRALEQLDD
jgi:hypothetical protein